MELIAQNKVSPVETSTVTLFKKLLCFACCCGIHVDNSINIGNKQNSLLNNSLDGEDPCNCCWFCGFCQRQTYTKTSDELLSTEMSYAYYGCCFCWDYEHKSYCCGVPLDK